MSTSSDAKATAGLGGVGRWVRTVFREPLVQFLALGLALFVGVGLVRAAQRPVLRLDAADIQQLVQYWRLQADRDPTAAELKGMIQDRIDEELLAREAVRLGLDRGDMIIRRRLAQKMSFASEDLGADAAPPEAKLRALYDQTKSTYAAPAQIAFRHVYFSQDRGASAARAAASAALSAALRGEEVRGDAFLLPLAYADAEPTSLSRDYGPDFAEAVASAPVGRWSGPFKSAYGFHLVFVEARRPPSTPSFEAVKSEVLDAYLSNARRARNAQVLDDLRRRFKIVVEDHVP